MSKMIVAPMRILKKFDASFLLFRSACSFRLDFAIIHLFMMAKYKLTFGIFRFCA
jgi:hypothetical protein